MSGLRQLVMAVGELPAEQRELLLPLIAWQMLESGTFPIALPVELVRDVTLLRNSLGNGTPEEQDAVLEARLTAAGITPSVFRNLMLAAGVPDASMRVSPFAKPSTPFVERAAPKAGQVRAGPTARHLLGG